MAGLSMRAGPWPLIAVLLTVIPAGGQPNELNGRPSDESLRLKYETAVTAAERQFGPDHPIVGRALSDLGRLHQFQGKYDQAEPVYKRALAIHVQASGPDHADIALTLEKFATLYRIQRRFADAETLLTRSLQIREKAFGSRDVNLYPSLESLAVLHQDQGRAADAELYLTRSLDVREKALGPDHPEVGQSLHELARFYRMQGRVREAQSSYDRAVAILGINHPEVIMSAIGVGNFGAAAHALGRQDLAGAQRDVLESAVRTTFFGQVTDLRWTGSRSEGKALLIEGEARHGNELWQSFAVSMTREDTGWKLGPITILDFPLEVVDPSNTEA